MGPHESISTLIEELKDVMRTDGKIFSGDKKSRFHRLLMILNNISIMFDEEFEHPLRIILKEIGDCLLSHICELVVQTFRENKDTNNFVEFVQTDFIPSDLSLLNIPTFTREPTEFRDARLDFWLTNLTPCDPISENPGSSDTFLVDYMTEIEAIEIIKRTERGRVAIQNVSLLRSRKLTLNNNNPITELEAVTRIRKFWFIYKKLTKTMISDFIRNNISISNSSTESIKINRKEEWLRNKQHESRIIYTRKLRKVEEESRDILESLERRRTLALKEKLEKSNYPVVISGSDKSDKTVDNNKESDDFNSDSDSSKEVNENDDNKNESSSDELTGNEDNPIGDVVEKEGKKLQDIINRFKDPCQYLNDAQSHRYDRVILETRSPELKKEKKRIIEETVMAEMKNSALLHKSSTKNKKENTKKSKKKGKTKKWCQAVGQIGNEEDCFPQLVEYAIIRPPDEINFDSLICEEGLALPSASLATQKPMNSIGLKKFILFSCILPLISTEIRRLSSGGVYPTCRSLLLYGPPGNRKKLIAHLIAHETHSTFIDISSHITKDLLIESKMGASIILLNVLTAAKVTAPAVIYCENVEQIFKLKRGKTSSTDTKDCTRFKKDFIAMISEVKIGTQSNDEDRIIFIGVTDDPITGVDSESLISAFDYKIWIDNPSYELRMSLLLEYSRWISPNIEELENEGSNITNDFIHIKNIIELEPFNTNKLNPHNLLIPLCELLNGYSVDDIRNILTYVLTKRRIELMKIKPLKLEEFEEVINKMGDNVLKEKEKGKGKLTTDDYLKIGNISKTKKKGNKGKKGGKEKGGGKK